MPIISDGPYGPDVPDLAGEPLTLDLVKLHCKVEHDVDDALLAGMIVAAREYAEHETGRLYAPKTRTLALDAFPSDYIRLPYMPLVSVNSISYTDTAGTTQTFSGFGAEVATTPGYVYLQPGFSWPAAMSRPGAVKVTFTGGMDPADVPYCVRQWMLLRIAALYENRGAWSVGKAIEENRHIDRLLDSQRVYFGEWA